MNLKQGRPELPQIELAENAAEVEISAVLTRMKGLSSEGILQALADMGKDSTWFAGELGRLYDSTDEMYYKTKLLTLAHDLIRQHEGQKLNVEGLSGASNADLVAIEKQALLMMKEAVEGEGIDEQSIVGAINEAALPSPEGQYAEGPVPAQAGEDGEGSTGRRDPEPLPTIANCIEVSPVRRSRKGVPRRK
jgi:hypothetical protein